MKQAAHRLAVLSGHVLGCRQLATPAVQSSPCSMSSDGGEPRDRDYDWAKKRYKWNGWGYGDTEYTLTEDGQITLTGNRYSLSGAVFPSLREWTENSLGIRIDEVSPPKSKLEGVPAPIRNAAFQKAIEGAYKAISDDPSDRVFHAHGHTLDEIFTLRRGQCYERIPDLVIWPGEHEHVEKIVAEAVKHDVCIIPYGGGTTVTDALKCPENESRLIVSLDMHEMSKIKWVDQESMLACIEAGAVGQDLDRRLQQRGYLLGHEPDSFEFSTLGGWIATRASGMKKNVYGNIEDMIIGIKIVTPAGTIEKNCQVPRISCGPDIYQFILGSEGTLGVITEAVLRIRPIPEVQEYGSIAFPCFEDGVACLREVTRAGVKPASIRLVDNTQFKFGQVLKPANNSKLHKILDWAKKAYVLKVMGFDQDEMVAATLVFEGTREHVEFEKRKVYSIAAKHKGLKAGAENGKRGFFLTYMIAYLRDYGFNYWYIGESFETSVPWSNVATLIKRVKRTLTHSCKRAGIAHEPFISARVTQCYETGACVYFYFGFMYKGLADPVATYHEIEHAARDEVLANGGSLSHHHGIGKVRKHWVEQTLSPGGVQMLKGVKTAIDPKNIFCANNVIDVDPSEASAGKQH